MSRTRNHSPISGRRLACLERRSERARRTLLLLHAFPLNADMWTPQFDAIADDWWVIAPDLRGFGESESDPGGSTDELMLDDYARDVLALLDRLAVRRAVVAGLSLGGYVAFALLRLIARQETAAAGPEALTIDGLVLADTRPQADTDEGRTGRRGMMDTVGREGTVGVVDEMLSKLIAPETRRRNSTLVGWLRREILAAPPGAINAALSRMMRRADSTPLLSGIACPTLIVVGAHDVLTPPNVSRAMQDGIRGATLEIIPSAGHLASLENPDAFNTVLSRFLSRV